LTLIIYLKILKLKGNLQIINKRFKLYIAFKNAFIILNCFILRLKQAIIAIIILKDFNASVVM
jgi:hypothetical protein